MDKDKAIITDEKTAFESYVLNNISAAEYKQLPKLMGMSQYATTRMFNQPKRMSLEQIERLAEILNKHPYELISHYKLGYKVVTLDDMEQIRRGYED